LEEDREKRKKRRKGVIILVFVGFALGLGALAGWMGAGWARERPLPVPMTGDCITAGCHDAAGKEAKMYVTADEEEFQPGESLVAVADTSFELDFYFEGMVGEKDVAPVVEWLTAPEPYRSVGIELVVQPGWDVAVGTEAGPEGWSRAWQRGSSGGGEWRSTRWQPVEGAAGRYYLDFRNSSWRTYGDLPALAANHGNRTHGDLDGMAEKMGSDVTVGVPPETMPGQYEIVVIGVGHNDDGQRAHIARTIPVSVTPAKYMPPAPVLPDGQYIYTTLCSSCHDDTGGGKAKLLRRGVDRVEWVVNWGTGEMAPVRGLDEGEVEALVGYMQASADPIEYIVPRVPHQVEGRVCLRCHGADAIRPYPAGHKSFGQLQCVGCHQQSPDVIAGETPQVPHPGPGRICLDCHSTGGLVPVTRTHDGRGNDICLACHPVVAEMVDVAVPKAPHRVGPDKACSSCHGPGGSKPMPLDHEGREDRLCVACHEADQAIVAGIPLMPHTYEGREACLACHNPVAGWKPAPEDHRDRTQETCVVCHR
jgi:predicted CXXCH cytochrome family protein